MLGARSSRKSHLRVEGGGRMEREVLEGMVELDRLGSRRFSGRDRRPPEGAGS